MAESTDGLGVRLEFRSHGDRDRTYLAAIDFFDRSFEKGWRLVHVTQELNSNIYHDDLTQIAEGDDDWIVEYDAVGVLRGSHVGVRGRPGGAIANG